MFVCVESLVAWKHTRSEEMAAKNVNQVFFFLEEVACGLLLVLGYFGKLLSVKKFLTKGRAIYCTNQRINQ